MTRWWITVVFAILFLGFEIGLGLFAWYVMLVLVNGFRVIRRMR